MPKIVPIETPQSMFEEPSCCLFGRWKKEGEEIGGRRRRKNDDKLREEGFFADVFF